MAGAIRAKFRRRRSPAEDKVSILEREEQREVEAPRAPEDHLEEEVGCASKTVAFAALPEKYQPLAWDGEQPPPRKTERASKARKRRLKKYGKLLFSSMGLREAKEKVKLMKASQQASPLFHMSPKIARMTRVYNVILFHQKHQDPVAAIGYDKFHSLPSAPSHHAKHHNIH